MIDEKKLEVLKKLKALAERGEPKEREVAQQMLSKLMKKYKVESADLSEDIVEEHTFTYHDGFQKKLLWQLFYKVARDRKVYYYKRGAGSRSELLFHGTKAEALQIQIEYEFYCELWKEEVKFFMECFIQKHRIFPTDNDAEAKEIDMETLIRMQRMMSGMQNKTILPMLEEGEGA